jgi:hypothetical protein
MKPKVLAKTIARVAGINSNTKGMVTQSSFSFADLKNTKQTQILKFILYILFS